MTHREHIESEYAQVEALPIAGEPSNGDETSDVFVLPTSLGQDRFWELDRLSPGNPTWNVPVRFRLQGALDAALVSRAFNEIVSRHEVLRTTIALVDGKPSQVINSVMNIKVPLTDLRNLAKPERDAAVDRLSFEEARRGFDLAAGPLLRVSLIRVEDNEHVMLVTPHHTVGDYLSIGLISNELGILYDAYTRDFEPDLPKLPIQYGDFAVWQREQMLSPVVQQESTYWKDQLKNLPLLEFPTDHPRLAAPTYNASINSILLPTTLTDAVREIANRNGATFFNTMLAALAVVLHQHTGQTDFGVATQVSGRSDIQLEPLIGLFINNVVLRTNLSGDPPFSQLLGRVQEVGLQSIANQNVRFEQVLKELRPGDYPSHHTLFRINFICQRDPVKPAEFAGIKLSVIPSKSQGALYDLHVFLVQRAEGWRLACEYNTDLYNIETITSLLGDYRILLENIVEDPDRRISQFRPTPGALARQAAKTSITPDTNSSGVQSSGELSAVDTAKLDAPESLPSVEQESDGELEPVRYVMPSSAAQLRFWVLDELEPGNPALHMRACVRLTGDLSEHTLEESFQFLVDRHETLRTTFERLDDGLVQVIVPSRKISLPVTSLEHVSAADREARLSESIRIEVIAPFELTRGPLMRARLFRLEPQLHVLVITTHHILVDGWSQNVIQRDLWAAYESLSAGQEPSLPLLKIQYGDFVDWQKKWVATDNAKEHLDFWRKKLATPPPVLNLPTDRPFRNRLTSKGGMETILLPEDLVRSLKSLTQSQGLTTFMATLACFGVLLNCYTGQDDILVGSPVANRGPETEPLIGPFSGPVAMRLDLSNSPTWRDLFARVRSMTLDALSHADFPFESILESVDLRSVHGRSPLSQCYFFYQVAFLQPREMRGLTVTPMPDFGLGTYFELQMGLLERSEGVRAQLEYNSDLFDAPTIRRFLQDYAKILQVMVATPERRIDQLPVSIELRPGLDSRGGASQVEITLPQDGVEKQLTKIWEEHLGVHLVGIPQNYFELGGNSLLALRLMAQIEKEFQVSLPLSILFEAQTIEEFARVLESRRKGSESNWSPLVAIQPNGDRPIFFCVHAAGGNVLVYRDLSKRLGPDQPFYGLQSQGLDGKMPLLTRIEDMAALYVGEIRRIQPHGPYFIGGYCLGGTVALEIASQLRAQGEEVGLLALFDTLNWCRVGSSSVTTKIYQQVQRFVYHGMNFSLLSFKEKAKFFSEKLKMLRARLTVWRGMVFGGNGEEQGSKISESSVLAKIWEANDQAALEYVPRPYPGVITDFRPKTQYSRYSGLELKWSEIALEGEEIVSLPVYPAGMLIEPFVKDLADALRAEIEKSTGKTVAPARPS